MRSIGYGAFGSNNLTKVEIPGSVTEIQGYAFSDNNLTRINIPEGVAYIGISAFGENNITSIDIPESVSEIGSNAFTGNNLKSLKLSSNLDVIDNYAFAGNQLESITIPSGITSIGSAAFASNSIEELEIPDGVVAIGSRAFEFNRLRSVEIPSSVRTIGDYAFAYNPLKKIIVPDNPLFDLSVLPNVEVINKSNSDASQTSDPSEGPENDQIASINAVITQDKVSTVQLTEPISVGNQDIETVIVGTKKKDKITGTSDREVLAGQEGKDALKGGDDADGFLFNTPNGFGKKQADVIKDFDPNEGDLLLVDKDVFGLGNEVELKVVTGKKASKKASKSNNNFIYDNKKGLLFFNENGQGKGWGNGGLFAKLQGAPELDASDFTIV